VSRAKQTTISGRIKPLEGLKGALASLWLYLTGRKGDMLRARRQDNPSGAFLDHFGLSD
jgi:hypothetical protein